MFVELPEEDVKKFANAVGEMGGIYASLAGACLIAMSQDQNCWQEKIAFAERRRIQYLDQGIWIDYNTFDMPNWKDYHWRIKPEPKPDYVRYITELNSLVLLETGELKGASIKLVRDGETGELKSCELIK